MSQDVHPVVPLIPQDTRKQGVLWALGAYLAQAPIVVWYSQGRIPSHPVVLMLPLVGLLNGKVERRGPEGLGRWWGLGVLCCWLWYMLPSRSAAGSSRFSSKVGPCAHLSGNPDLLRWLALRHDGGGVPPLE